MKEFDSKLQHADPFHPEVMARVIELIRSMTPEEAKTFLEYRKPGIPEYWFGEPIPKKRHKRQKENAEQDNQG